MKCSLKYYSGFKEIRNKLRYFRKDQIVIICFKNLASTWNMDPLTIVQKTLPMPWHVMLILKWGMVYGANKIDGKPFEQKNFNTIYNLINELPTNLGWLDSGDLLSLWKLMRATMFGQYAYQTKMGFYGLAVTEIILKDIGISYDVDKTLNMILGVNIEEFCNFQSLLTAIYVASNNYQTYNVDFFSTFSDKHDIKKIEQFLNYFSMNFYELETFMIEHHKAIDNPEFEYNLLSPLIRKPLYRFNKNYVAYNKTLINHFCEYGLYDLLKNADPESFSGAFGHGFETYLTYSLNSLGIDYLREFDIRKTFNVKSSVDFLSTFEKDVLLIEAKSSEMPELTPQNPQKKFLEQTFQNSLIKGYKQIILTATELKKQNPSKFGKSNFWALIVTYKDLMFGSPEVIWLEFLEEKMKELLPSDIFNNLPIDPLKIFVISVYEFDSLCLYTKRRDSNLISSLTIPFENNKEPETKRFSFFLNYPQNKIMIKDFDHTKVKLEEIIQRIKNYIE